MIGKVLMIVGEIALASVLVGSLYYLYKVIIVVVDIWFKLQL